MSAKSSRLFVFTLLAVACMVASEPAFAGIGFRQQSVGGVMISTDGVLTQPTASMVESHKKTVQKNAKGVPSDLRQTTEMRKVSLRQLEKAIVAAGNDIRTLPDEIKYLAGIQRIQYVFVYPNQNDIVLAGPGEGWRVNEKGIVVGETTGQPVVLLEDLIVALQTVEAARQGGISCSIDPTVQGRKAMNAFLRRQSSVRASGGIDTLLDSMAEKMGPQQITITGIPETSHLARVLVAADYRMKRIAMDLETSPIKELDSYLTMLKTSSKSINNMTPRWWLATDYEPLAKSDDGLAWELRGQGVKAMTEDEVISQDGTVEGTGKVSPLAQKWADTMTANYDKLSKKEAIFGQLRNVMDVCVISALIKNEGLLEQAKCDLPMLLGEEKISLHSFNPPKTVSTQCSCVKRGSSYIMTASGGVMIESWQAATRSQTSPRLKQLRSATVHQPSNNFWWN